jgi:hypothetical protein
MGGFQRVTGYDIYMLGSEFGSESHYHDMFEIQLFYGEELLSLETVSYYTCCIIGSLEGTFHRNVVFAQAFPVPQADEIWLSVRAVKNGGANWWMAELELYAHEWESDGLANIALGGSGLGTFVLLSNVWC